MDCEYLQPLALLALLIIVVMVLVWVFREMRPLVYDGYAAGGRIYSNQNQVTYVGTSPCADRVSAGPGCGSNYGCVKPEDARATKDPKSVEGFALFRKSKFFPMNGTTFFGADGIMEHVTDPDECRRIGTKPQFMMIQDGKPVYRCIRYGEPMITVRTK